MRRSTSTKQRDILNTQNNIEDNPNSNSSQLISKTPIDKTPFWVVGTEEKGYFITMGKYRITEPFKTQEEAIKETLKKEWETIINVIGIIVEETVKKELQIKEERQQKANGL